MFLPRSSLRPLATARDRRTLELRNLFPIPSPGEAAQYSIDRWFFFPRNVAVNAETFGPEDFYRNSQVLMRLQPLHLDLAQLADTSDPRNPGRLLLHRGAQLLEAVPGHGASMSTIAQLYGAELVDAIHSGVEHVMTLGERGGTDLVAATQSLCDRVFEALDTLGRVRRSLLPFGPIAHPELLPSLAFAEEYAYAVVDERLSELALAIGQRESLRDGSGVAVRCHLVLTDAMTRLSQRRRDHGYIRPGHRQGEHYAYRIGLLKKMLQRSLYVDTRANKADPLIANSAAMIAAGLAATWATIAQVPLFQANLTTAQGGLIFGGAVAAYMVKDRIKDIVRNRLLARLRPWDHNQRIGTTLFKHLGSATFDGRSRERVRWESETAVEPEILNLRKAHRTVTGTSTELEQVLHYSRRLEINGTGERQAAGETPWGIQSIFRFSLSDIMARLDDPLDEITYFDDNEGRFRAGTLPKVYHVNVVHRTRNDDTGDVYTARLRVVLNRKEILRVEPVEASLD